MLDWSDRNWMQLLVSVISTKSKWISTSTTLYVHSGYLKITTSTLIPKDYPLEPFTSLSVHFDKRPSTLTQDRFLVNTYKKCAPIFDEIKGIQGNLKDHIEIIRDFDIDFQFCADLYIIFGKLMDTLNIYQDPMSSAASVINHYQEIIRMACLRKI